MDEVRPGMKQQDLFIPEKIIQCPIQCFTDCNTYLALKEFSLGMESLDRFIRSEPLYRVHECAFGVLAMESEPVDPRL